MLRIPAHLHRHPQSGIFYFRLTVPQHLRDTIGKREIKRSLRTGMRSEAIILAQQHYIESRQLFIKTEVSMATKRNKSDDEISFALTILKLPGTNQEVKIERDDPKEEAEIAAHLLRVSGQKTQDAAPVKKKEGPSLSRMIIDLVNEKKRTGGWTTKTVEENEAIFQLLKEVLKNPAAETIGFAQSRHFKETLLKLPPNRHKGQYKGKTVKQIIAMNPSKIMSISSVNKYLGRISSLFTWGVRHGYINDNPFSGLAIKQKRRPHQERDRFTLEELQRLLNPQTHTINKLRKIYQYWLPWLGLYTGARLEELCQLHIDDIKQDGDFWLLDINDREEKKLKSAASDRHIPIHPEIIALGFIDYVEGLRKQGEKRLFPELEQRRDGYGQTASKWFGRHRNTLNISKSFHSLRHTFIDELRQCGADHKKIEALAGHTDSSMTGGRYGKPFRPDVLYPVVCTLKFDLSDHVNYI